MQGLTREGSLTIMILMVKGLKGIGMGILMVVPVIRVMIIIIEKL